MKGVAYYNKDFLAIKEDEDLLKESVIRILLTSPGERVNNPNFGCKLKEFLFEFDVYILEDIKYEIRKSIERWEPHVTVSNIVITKKEDYKFYVLVEAISNNTGELISYETIINL